MSSTSSFSLKTIDQFDVSGKTVLLRADLNVPVDADKNITDTARIDRLRSTIHYLREQNAKIIVISHFGRPKGQSNPDLSLKFIIPALQTQWGANVEFCDTPIGDRDLKNHIKEMKNSDILVLENIRFYPGEEKNDLEFAQDIAGLGDLYINDAFSAAHRAHASTCGIAQYLPSAAGLLMAEEINALTNSLENPERPALAIVGGAKISTKLDVLQNLVRRVEYLVLGGGMANTFLYAKGLTVGTSLCEADMVDQAQTIMAEAKQQNCELILPIDVVCAKEFAAGAPHILCSHDQVPQDQMILDIGPQSIAYICDRLRQARTIMWNGPVGVFEMPPFDQGTMALGREIAALSTPSDKKNPAILSVAGGGDTLAAIDAAGIADQLGYISTAGGAFLEWLEGKTLPGIAALSQA